MTSVVEGFQGHYSVNDLDGGMADVRQILGEGADGLNWLFLSTSGVHGSYMTLDDLTFQPEPDEPDLLNNDVTVLIVQPRMVRSYYGHIEITPDDVPWLREQVRRTLDAVAKSQKGNT